METIYSTARNTVIYLGESSENLEPALAEFPSVESNARSRAIQIGPALAGLPTQLSSATSWLLKTSLLARPWFTRVWIVQELALSHNPWVQCGQHRIKWSSFYNHMISSDELVGVRGIEFQNNFDFSPELEDMGSKRLFSLNEARLKYHTDLQHHTNHQTLIDILVSRRGAEATDPRDTIFGYMEIATLPVPETKHESKALFYMITSPNYAKSAPQVFNEFAYDLLRWSAVFGVFLYVKDIDPSMRRLGLASWAPDWTKYKLHSPQAISAHPITSRYTWRGSWQSSIFYCDPGACLLIIFASCPDAIVEASTVIPEIANDLISLGDLAPIFLSLKLSLQRNLQQPKFNKLRID